jgi:uncharacterized membrane protein
MSSVAIIPSIVLVVAAGILAGLCYQKFVCWNGWKTRSIAFVGVVIITLINELMNIVVIIISGILGATVTFYISDKLKQSAVRSSALLSLIVALFFIFLK